MMAQFATEAKEFDSLRSPRSSSRASQRSESHDHGRPRLSLCIDTGSSVGSSPAMSPFVLDGSTCSATTKEPLYVIDTRLPAKNSPALGPTCSGLHMNLEWHDSSDYRSSNDSNRGSNESHRTVPKPFFKGSKVEDVSPTIERRKSV